MIAVVDYGMGNLRSVAKALAHVAPATRVVVTGDARVIGEAAKVVLPGQSAMPDCIAHLDASGLRGAVLDAARTRPFLGICLGLQMLFDDSEEGPTRCLGLFPGMVRRFDAARMTGADGHPLKVPHMGWNRVHPVRAHPMLSGIADGERFYFAHSYHPVPLEPALTAATTDYPAPFTCAIARANIFATQFHPEKSQRAGLALLANFVGWDGQYRA